MDKEQATRILNSMVSQHTGAGVFPEPRQKYYSAEFNIKVYRIDLPVGMKEYAESKGIDLDEWISDSMIAYRDHIIEELTSREMNPVSFEIQGRSGGWLVANWHYPKTAKETIVIAQKIKGIASTIKEELTYIASEEFWGAEWDSLLEFDLEEQAEQAEFDLPFPIL